MRGFQCPGLLFGRICVTAEARRFWAKCAQATISIRGDYPSVVRKGLEIRGILSELCPDDGL